MTRDGLLMLLYLLLVLLFTFLVGWSYSRFLLSAESCFLLIRLPQRVFPSSSLEKGSGVLGHSLRQTGLEGTRSFP